MLISPAKRSGKHVAMINGLPKQPDGPIIWIVYNEDMVGYVQNLISDIKGKDYLDEFVTVVPRSSSSKYNGKIYFDPMLMDHIGNGEV